MGAGRTDKNDRLTRFQPAYPMQDLQRQQRPTFSGLVDNFLQRLLCHPRGMLEEHSRDVATVIKIAHVADETSYRTDTEIGRMQGIELGAGIKWILLDSYTHGQPPVTVGKNATSSPSANGSSRLHSS